MIKTLTTSSNNNIIIVSWIFRKWTPQQMFVQFSPVQSRNGLGDGSAKEQSQSQHWPNETHQRQNNNSVSCPFHSTERNRTRHEHPAQNKRSCLLLMVFLFSLHSMIIWSHHSRIIVSNMGRGLNWVSHSEKYNAIYFPLEFLSLFSSQFSISFNGLFFLFLFVICEWKGNYI